MSAWYHKQIISLYYLDCRCLCQPVFTYNRVYLQLDVAKLQNKYNKNKLSLFYLKEDIWCIVHTHDHSPSSEHVVGIGECDEDYGGQVVDKHDDEILPLMKWTRWQREIMTDEHQEEACGTAAFHCPTCSDRANNNHEKCERLVCKHTIKEIKKNGYGTKWAWITGTTAPKAEHSVRL